VSPSLGRLHSGELDRTAAAPARACIPSPDYFLFVDGLIREIDGPHRRAIHL
jgi:hypothetical protein